MKPALIRILEELARRGRWVAWSFGAPIDPRWTVPPHARGSGRRQHDAWAR